MNDEGRRASVVALAELALSSDYRDRADAGRALASFAESAQARATLLELLLDADDTFVTRATAEALLGRKDPIGLSIVAAALAVADMSHDDWIGTAVIDVLGVFATDRDEAMRQCQALVQGSDERIRQGADQLMAILADTHPVFYPEPNE